MTFASYCETVAESMGKLAAAAPVVDSAVEILVATLRGGGKVMFCGNGGSAADAQHLAAELMGRFLVDRPPLAALALTVDTSALTAIANDYAFDQVFARQLLGVGRRGDTLVGLSTSGNSRNVLNALRSARAMGISTVGLTGATGGAMPAECDVCIRVPSDHTNHIQEQHIVIGHYLCARIEEIACQSAKA